MYVFKTQRIVIRIIVFRISVFVSFFLIGCQPCKYSVTPSYFEGSCIIDYMIAFQEIEVLSYRQDSIPENYKESRVVLATLRDTNRLGAKRIYFNKRNENFEWIDLTTMQLSDTLPINIEKDKWYRIRGFLSSGGVKRAVFFKLNNHNDIRVFFHNEDKIY